MANFKTRIKQKNDSTANWNTANTTGFKPLQGEIIVYNDVNRIKIGDGTNTVSNVPFLDANCVHLTGAETIDGYKTFEGGVLIREASAVFTGTGTEESPNYIIDCYEDAGTNDSLFAVKALGEDKGQVLFGDGTIDCSINFGEGSYITSSMLLCPADGKTAYPQNSVSDAGMMIKSSASISTSYGASTIVRVNNGSPTMIQLPSTGGTLALTSDIPSTSNFVTTNTNQSISGIKTFSSNTTHTSGITSKRAAAGYLLDCYSSASGASTSTIFGAQLITPGASSVKPVGKVRIGQSGTECAIELAGSEGTSGQVLTSQGSNKTPVWKTVTASAPSNMVTTDTAQTITGKKTLTEAVVSYLTLNNGLYTYSSYGTFGQALISGGGKVYSNRWKTITASDNIPISYAIGTASNVGYGSGGYGTYTSITFTGYKVAADILDSSGHLSSTKYIHVYTTEFTKNVAAGRWVHFKGWRNDNINGHETILSVIVTPSKNTTSGYGPRMISWFTGANVYVAADDDNDEKGFSITVITQDA